MTNEEEKKIDLHNADLETVVRALDGHVITWQPMPEDHEYGFREKLADGAIFKMGDGNYVAASEVNLMGGACDCCGGGFHLDDAVGYIMLRDVLAILALEVL